MLQDRQSRVVCDMCNLGLLISIEIRRPVPGQSASEPAGEVCTGSRVADNQLDNAATDCFIFLIESLVIFILYLRERKEPRMALV